MVKTSTRTRVESNYNNICLFVYINNSRHKRRREEDKDLFIPQWGNLPNDSDLDVAPLQEVKRPVSGHKVYQITSYIRWQ